MIIDKTSQKIRELAVWLVPLSYIRAGGCSEVGYVLEKNERLSPVFAGAAKYCLMTPGPATGHQTTKRVFELP